MAFNAQFIYKSLLEEYIFENKKKVYIIVFYATVDWSSAKSKKYTMIDHETETHLWGRRGPIKWRYKKFKKQICQI